MTLDDSGGGSLIKLEGAERALAEVATAQDAVSLIDLAEAARVFAKQAKLGTASVNHATAIKMKAERKLAEVVDAGQADGSIATQKDGGPKNHVRTPDMVPPMVSDPAPRRPATLDEIGVDRRRLNEARIIRDTYTDEDIDEIVEGATAEDVTVARRDFVKKKAHVGHNSGNNEWYTPPEFIEAARRVFRQTTNPCECEYMDGDDCCCIAIELDPATSETAQRIVKAAAYYTAEHDGLAHRWHGTVWLNPPYSQPLIGQFISKLVGHINGNDVPQAIVLVNNGTDTAWGQMLLENASAVCFPSRRIKFHDANGNPTGAPLQGQMIVHLESPQERVEAAVEGVQTSTRFELEFGDFGVVLKR